MDVRLEAFEGPMDLLLRLIERSEIDIYDIPIAVLTEQYMEVIKQAPVGMEGMSEFLLMAATLLEIKSRMLLPKPAAPETESGEDPREALVRKLLEYKHMQTLAEQLKAFASPGERIVREGERKLLDTLTAYEPSAIMEGVPLDALWHVFADVVRRRELRTDPVRAHYGDMPRERYTVEEKIAHVIYLLSLEAVLQLSALFEACVSRGELVTTFLALLEMIRRGQLRVRQSEAFSEVYIEAQAEE